MLIHLPYHAGLLAGPPIGAARNLEDPGSCLLGLDRALVVPYAFKIGNSVWVRRHQTKTLEPRWRGPYSVLPMTPIALKVDEITAWIHTWHVKAAQPEHLIDNQDLESPWRLQHTQNPLKIRLDRA